MDLFKYDPLVDDVTLVQGQFISNTKSVMWVERYLQPGEFTITAQVSSGLREFLPIGTLISHVDTLEVMIVENHEITEQYKEDPTLKITGRSFETFLEQRIVGTSLARISSIVRDYSLAANFSWVQAVTLINDHIWGSAEPTDNVNVFASHTITGTSVSEARTIERGSLHDRVMELLKVDDLGIKTVRQNTFPGGAGSVAETTLVIHNGVDRSANVVFSWRAGDLDTAAYLFTNKNAKNAALVVSRYSMIFIDSTGTPGYNKRVMLVDAGDLDDYFSEAPTGTDLTNVLNLMGVRGRQWLTSQNSITISQTDISNTSRYRYRTDYNVGDLISLDGDFGSIEIMRVSEFAEIEDENGESGHPTLSFPGA